MTIAAPFDRYRGEVLPEWIDINGHMNLAYYSVLFDYATDVLFDMIGIGQKYKRATNHGTFVVETHNIYEQELLVGEQVRVVSQILGADAKRLHLAHEMFRLADERRSATQELMFLSIDLSRRESCHFRTRRNGVWPPRRPRMPIFQHRIGPDAISRCPRMAARVRGVRSLPPFRESPADPPRSHGHSAVFAITAARCGSDNRQNRLASA